MTELQDRAIAWHQERFPHALADDVVLKAVSELGEVADARIAETVRNHSCRGVCDDVPTEAADVVVSLLVLVGRYYPGRDLLAAVDAKLAVLEDRTSSHRSSLLEDR